MGEGREILHSNQLESVGSVGVAQQQVGAFGGEHAVVIGPAVADECEVGRVVAATPADRPEVMNLEAVAAVAAEPAAFSAIAEPYAPHHLG